LCLPFPAATLDFFNIEGMVLAALDLRNRALELLVLPLTRFQQIKGHSDNFSWLLENARSDLSVDELLLLRSKFNHGILQRETVEPCMRSLAANKQNVKITDR
jgi:hypothetical protein